MSNPQDPVSPQPDPSNPVPPAGQPIPPVPPAADPYGAAPPPPVPNAGPAPTRGYSGPEGIETNSEARTFGMLCHLLAIFTGFIGPLVIWLIKKDQYAFVDDQGKEALNFQITVFIAGFASAILIYVCIGGILLPIVILANLVLCTLATVAANSGQRYRYPFCLRLIK